VTRRSPLSIRTGRGARGAVAAVGIACLIAVGVSCSGDDDTSARSSTTAPSTSVAAPSTVDDADFDKQAATAEAMIANAGNDPCRIVTAFAPASSLPTPINAEQTQRGVKVIAGLFTSAADSAPPAAAGDAAVLRQAATDLVAEGEAAQWSPDWLLKIPKAISDAKVVQAFTNYQKAVATTCGGATTTPP